jgi:hypothetical protein
MSDVNIDLQTSFQRFLSDIVWRELKEASINDPQILARAITLAIIAKLGIEKLAVAKVVDNHMMSKPDYKNYFEKRILEEFGHKIAYSIQFHRAPITAHESGGSLLKFETIFMRNIGLEKTA